MDLKFIGGEEGIQIIENYFINPDSLHVEENGVVVECGSAEGFFNPSLTLESLYGWKYYGFEPDPFMYSIFPTTVSNSSCVIKSFADVVSYVQMIP
jgi:hypothetical protein